MKIKTYKYLGLGLVILGSLVLTDVCIFPNFIEALLQHHYSSYLSLDDLSHRVQTIDQYYAMTKFGLEFVILPAMGSLLAVLVILLIYFRKKRKATTEVK